MTHRPPAFDDVTQSGLLWNALSGLRSGLVNARVPWVSARATHWIEKLMVGVEMRHFLVGERTISATLNTVPENVAQWDLYHAWSRGGDEWTPSPE